MVMWILRNNPLSDRIKMYYHRIEIGYKEPIWREPILLELQAEKL